jgi:hypothetical protein
MLKKTCLRWEQAKQLRAELECIHTNFIHIHSLVNQQLILLDMLVASAVPFFLGLHALAFKSRQQLQDALPSAWCQEVRLAMHC